MHSGPHLVPPVLQQVAQVVVQRGVRVEAMRVQCMRQAILKHACALMLGACACGGRCSAALRCRCAAKLHIDASLSPPHTLRCSAVLPVQDLLACCWPLLGCAGMCQVWVLPMLPKQGSACSCWLSACSPACWLCRSTQPACECDCSCAATVCKGHCPCCARPTRRRRCGQLALQQLRARTQVGGIMGAVLGLLGGKLLAAAPV